MANKLKARIAAGKACVNGWLAIPSGFSAEVMAQCGWDSVTVDMQHGVQDYPVDGAVLPGDGQSIRSRRWCACRGTSPASSARCSTAAPGASSARWSTTRPRRKALATACLYPPQGKRSNGPIRAAMYGEASNYQKIANDEVLVIPMIETQEGDRQHRRDPRRAGHQRHLYRPVRHGPVARPDPDAGPRGAADPRRSTRSCWRPARSTASSPACTTARRPMPRA